MTGGRTVRANALRALVVVLAAAYFGVPVLASFLFSIKDIQTGAWTGEYYSGVVTADGFGQALRTSLMLAALVIAISLALMLPTMLVVHLRLPQVRQLVELITLLPLIIPPIVFVVGIRTVLGWGPDYFSGTGIARFLAAIQEPDLPWILVFSYVMLAMPFTYRSLDAGLRAIDLHTQVEAARNLGARWPTVLTRIAVPGLRGSLLNASFLAFALVFGEYTISSILLFTPFPVWLVALGLDHAQLSVSVSLLSLFLTWIALLGISAIGSRGGRSANLRSV